MVTIDPGDSIRFQALDALWNWERVAPYFSEVDPELDGGHPLAGPVAVRGVRAGDTLVVRTDEVRPREWGATYLDEGPLVWRLDPDRATGTDNHGVEVALAPFLGVIGMPPAAPGIHSTIPPRRCGGNIDCRELVAGTTLFLPVEVDGALLSAGDAHAAQGDGEVSGTAIETPIAEARLTVDVRRDLDLRMPVARTADAWIAFGFDNDLDVAADLALQTMLDLMEREHGLGRSHALALASVAVDLHVTQIVNDAKGVHAILRDSAIRLPRRP